MFKIALINMPFGNLNWASLGLTQLKSIIDNSFAGRVSTAIRYLNVDFAELVGFSAYQAIAVGVNAWAIEQTGDWFFRQAAFPEAPDNTQEYLGHYFSNDRDVRAQLLKEAVRGHRGKLDLWLDQVIQRYDLHHADIVGMTAFWGQSTPSIALARRLKRINPDIITVMGGPHCDSPAAQVLVKHVPDVDFVFSGPSLVSFRKFVGCCLDGRQDQCAAIPGVFSRAEAGRESVANAQPDAAEDPTRLFGEHLDIDLYPKPQYDEFIELYERTFSKRGLLLFLPFTTSEGCWWRKCTFCSFNRCHWQYRQMSPEKAREQLEWLFRYQGKRRMIFATDNIMPPAFLKKALPQMRAPKDVNIVYDVKPDTLTEEDFERLSGSGVSVLFAGVDSLASSTLELMHKGQTVFDNLIFLKRCLHYHRIVMWQLLLGMPGEKAEVYEKYLRDIRWLRHLPPPEYQVPITFLRRSLLQLQADTYGIDLRPKDSYAMIYPFPKECLQELAIWFQDVNKDAEYSRARDVYWDRVKEQVGAWRGRWARGFLLSRKSQPNASSMLKLVFVPRNEGVVVYDSRFEAPVERHLTDLQTKILEHLSSPGRLSGLGEDLRIPSDPCLQEAVNPLLDWGLVFQEGDRALSLVEGSHARWETMTTRELLSSLEVLDLELRTENGSIKYRAAPGVLTETLRRELEKRRGEIAQVLPEIDRQRENSIQMLASYPDILYVEQSFPQG